MRCDAMWCDATGDSGTVASPSVSRCTDSVSARTAILIPFANAIAIQLQFSSHSHSGSRRLSLPLSCVKLGNGFVCRYSPLSTLHSPLSTHHSPLNIGQTMHQLLRRNISTITLHLSVASKSQKLFFMFRSRCIGEIVVVVLVFVLMLWSNHCLFGWCCWLFM